MVVPGRNFLIAAAASVARPRPCDDHVKGATIKGATIMAVDTRHRHRDRLGGCSPT